MIKFLFCILLNVGNIWSMPPCNRGYMAEPSEEVRRVRNRIDGFDWEKSQTWIVLKARFGDRIRQDELVEVARLVSKKSGIKLDRDAQRRKSVMIKWFEENWLAVQQLLPSIVLE